jgi:hypothetical protein
MPGQQSPDGPPPPGPATTSSGRAGLLSRYWREILLLLGSLLVAVYMVETALQFLPEPYIDYLRKQAAGAEGRVFDSRSHKAVIAELRAQGSDAWAPYYPVHLQEADSRELLGSDRSLFLLGGIASVTTVYCNENGPWIVYESDERGFRNPRGLWGEAGIEAALIGDSFVHGACVEDGKDIGGWLRAHGAERTLALAQGGNNPLIYLATIKEYLGEVRPRHVFWFHFEGNDLAVDVSRPGTNPALRAYLGPEGSQGLADQQDTTDALLRRYIDERMSKSALNTTLSLLRLEATTKKLGKLLDPAASTASMQLADYRRILEEAQAFVAAWGGELVVVYLPGLERYKNRDDPALFRRGEFLAMVQELGLPLVDVHETFRRASDPVSLFSLRFGPHYNESGYALVGEAVLGYLRKPPRASAATP